MVSGKRRDVGLGLIKVLSFAEARTKALHLRRQVAQGIDPIAKRREVEDPVPTFRKVDKGQP